MKKKVKKEKVERKGEKKKVKKKVKKKGGKKRWKKRWKKGGKKKKKDVHKKKSRDQACELYPLCHSPRAFLTNLRASSAKNTVLARHRSTSRSQTPSASVLNTPCSQGR